MAVGVALLLDLLSRGPRAASSVHSHGSFSAAAAASAAAALAASGLPISSRRHFGFGGFTIAYCDAGVTADLNDVPDLGKTTNNTTEDSFKYPIKEYPLELKPLFSAFGLKSFSLTTLRSFLLYYLPLLEPRTHIEEDDDDGFLQDAPNERSVDLVTPFHNSVKQIFREIAVVTTRRVLERIAVYHVSQRTAWKLLKDASKSAKRKAQRGMPTQVYIFSVGRTTFRAHALGVAATWVVQTIIEIYRCFVRKPGDAKEEFEEMEKLKLFGRKVYGITIKCGASLVFASIGAGFGALLHPSHGQWIGCTLGDFAGPIIAIIAFERLHLQL